MPCFAEPAHRHVHQIRDEIRRHAAPLQHQTHPGKITVTIRTGLDFERSKVVKWSSFQMTSEL